MKKTIAILIPEGFSFKAYILNDFIDILSKKIRVIILTPSSNLNSLENKYLDNKNVFVKKLNVPPQSGMVYDELNNFFEVSHTYRVNRLFLINMLDKRTKRIYDAIEGFRIRSFIKLKIIRKISHFFAQHIGIYISINLQLLIEKFFYRSLVKESKRIEKIYSDYSVDAVFSSQPLIAYFDKPGVWAAKKMGLLTFSILTAWDNLSTKGRMPIDYSYYFVWSDWMSNELKKTHPNIKKEKIISVGSPALDFHFNITSGISKQKFCKMFNFDIDRPIILFATAPYGQSPNQPEMVEQLHLAIKDGKIRNNAQILLRAHPVGASSYWEKFRKKYPEICFTDFNVNDQALGINWAPQVTDLNILIASLEHCSLMINFSSTITLEAFIYDKPVINIAYDFDKNSFFNDITANAYNFDSFKPVVESDSTKIAYNFNDMVKFSNLYLSDMSQDSDNRKKLLKLICGYTDGKTHKRIAENIFNIFKL